LIEGTRENAANLLGDATHVEISPAPEEPAEQPTFGVTERQAVQW
jgi:hypothetical protein